MFKIKIIQGQKYVSYVDTIEFYNLDSMDGLKKIIDSNVDSLEMYIHTLPIEDKNGDIEFEDYLNFDGFILLSYFVKNIEIFDKIKYLCSFLAKYVTGSSINLDHRNFLILNQFKPVEALEIKQFESEIGTNLNMEYKTFLLESNGGNPVRNVFSIPNQGQDSIKMLYGLNSNSNNYDLRKQFLQFKHENSGQFLPIAEDGFGNQICLGLFENCSGKIYFWDRDIGENILIADSFDGFIKKLVKN